MAVKHILTEFQGGINRVKPKVPKRLMILRKGWLIDFKSVCLAVGFYGQHTLSNAAGWNNQTASTKSGKTEKSNGL